MLPSAVLTHLKAGVRAAHRPEPVVMTVCWHPASVTAGKQLRPSLTTSQAGSRLALGKTLDSAAAEARHPAQPQPHPLTVRRGLDRRQDGRLAGRAAATLAARALAAETGVVELDATDQPAFGVAFQHHLPEPVLDGPGGGLGHPEATGQLEAGD